MKIAVMSDSHDNRDNIRKAIAIANKNDCQFLFHLGDMISPFAAQELEQFHGDIRAVYGNCDGERLGLKDAFAKFSGEIQAPPFELMINKSRIVLMHEPYLLEDIVNAKRFDYIFYGHLHTVDFRKINNTYILNPGELGGWLHNDPTFYIVNLDTNSFKQIEISENSQK